MKDIEDIIEQMHEVGRGRLERECAQPEHRINPTTRVWRYAAAIAAIAVAGVMLLLLPTRHDQTMPDMADKKLPHTVKQQLQNSKYEALKHSDYAYSESADGVRVYCEDNCNPDEVLARMEMVIKTMQ